MPDLPQKNHLGIQHDGDSMQHSSSKASVSLPMFFSVGKKWFEVWGSWIFLTKISLADFSPFFNAGEVICTAGPSVMGGVAKLQDKSGLFSLASTMGYVTCSILHFILAVCELLAFTMVNLYIAFNLVSSLLTSPCKSSKKNYSRFSPSWTKHCLFPPLLGTLTRGQNKVFIIM